MPDEDVSPEGFAGIKRILDTRSIPRPDLRAGIPSPPPFDVSGTRAAAEEIAAAFRAREEEAAAEEEAERLQREAEREADRVERENDRVEARRQHRSMLFWTVAGVGIAVVALVVAIIALAVQN